MSPPVTLEPGQQTPDFTAIDGSGAEHRLSDYLGEGKTVILYFYPKDSTPGCTTQACDFRDNMNRLQSENTIVFGVSKDSAASHQKFATKQALNFPLLVDEDLSLHHAFGTWRLKKNYGREYMGCAFNLCHPTGRKPRLVSIQRQGQRSRRHAHARTRLERVRRFHVNASSFGSTC